VVGVVPRIVRQFNPAIKGEFGVNFTRALMETQA
jgi:hypothetical protein